ncbi:hypothetical protein RJ55_07462 [Drechmeria coniospora]|nr:hypothetical protein RJ55_07462 [Drechmeria coniospora]
MSSHVTILAGIVAAFGTLAAAESFTGRSLAYRLPNSVLGDACHPNPDASLTLGDISIIPACFAEQRISEKCELDTGALADLSNAAKMNAYRDCLFGAGSTYQNDRNACLTCKVENGIHTAAQDQFWINIYKKSDAMFQSANPLNKGLWQMTLALIGDWSTYPQPNAKPKAGYRASQARSHELQNVGSYSLARRSKRSDKQASASPAWKLDVEEAFDANDVVIAASARWY